MTALSTLKLPCSWGVVEITAEAGKVTACRLPMLDRQSSTPLRWKASVVNNAHKVNDAALRSAEAFVKALFDGSRIASPPITIPDGPAFHRRVWRQLVRVPFGKTTTYGDLARAVGCPKGARAVGQACGANPLPLFIPCHRVLAANGALGGFSCGTAWKVALLEAQSG
jgi:methylated-DNA-[protein]-cysteine S-methyltransferase